MSRYLLLMMSILLLAIPSLTNNCIRMKCGDIPQGVPSESNPSICAVKSTDLLGKEAQTIQQCPDKDYACAYEGQSQQSKCYNETATRVRQFPGNECVEDKRCLTGVCNSGVCKGNEEGEQCIGDSQCNMGLLCSSDEGICEKYRQIGEACDVNNHKVCVGWGSCFNSICTELLSLPVGQVLIGENITGGNPALCKTLTTSINSQNEFVCSSGYKLIGPVERSSFDHKCKYTLTDNDTITTEINPRCGMSKTGSYYCPLGYGDLQEQLNQIRSFFSKEPVCPITTYLNLNCKNTEGIEGRENALAALSLTQNLQGVNYSYMSVSIRDNDECVKSMFTQEYWSHVTEDTTLETSTEMKDYSVSWLQ